MIKPIRAALLLALAFTPPVAALDIICPFKPTGPIDPALLLDPNQEKPGSMDVDGRLVDLAGQPIAGGEVLLRWTYAPAETPPSGEEEVEDPSLTAEGEEAMAAEEVPANEPEPEAVGDEAGLGEEGNPEEYGEEGYTYVEIAVTRHARTDAKGYFRLTGVDPNQWGTLEASAKGYVSNSFDLGLIGERHFTPVFELARGGGLALEVVDPQGARLPEARVALVPPGDHFSLGIRLISDPTADDWTKPMRDGRFRLDRLSTGVGNLVVVAPSYRTKVVSVDVLPGDQPLDLGKVMLEPATTVRGRVVDRDGMAVADAAVQVQLAMGLTAEEGYLIGESATSDADGKFELTDRLPEGIGFALLASAEGYGNSRLVVESASSEPVELRLGGRRKVQGMVVRQADQSPIAECELYTSLDAPTMALEDFDSATTDVSGLFVFELAPEKPFTIHCHCGAQMKSVVVGEQIEQPLVIEMPASTFLRGRILRDEVLPDDTLMVIFRDFSGEVDADGNFNIEGFEAGAGYLMASSGEVSVNVPLEVPPEGLEGIEVRLPKSARLGRLEGKVLDPWGKPAASSWIQIYSETGLLLSTAMTLPDGSFRTSLIEKTKSWKVLTQWQERHVELPVEPAEGVQELEIAFPGETTLRGKVKGLLKGETGRLTVRLVRQRPGGTESEVLTEALTAQIDPSGNFEFEKVPEGEWQLRATVFGRNLTAEAQVEIGSQGTDSANLELVSAPFPGQDG